MLLWFGGSYWGSVGNVLVTLSFSRWVLVTPAGIFYFLSIAFCNSSRITADLFSALVRSSYNSGSWLRLIRRLTHTVFSAFHLACDLGSDIDCPESYFLSAGFALLGLGLTSVMVTLTRATDSLLFNASLKLCKAFSMLSIVPSPFLQLGLFRAVALI